MISEFVALINPQVTELIHICTLVPGWAVGSAIHRLLSRRTPWSTVKRPLYTWRSTGGQL
jgi:hypothetical protein